MKPSITENKREELIKAYDRLEDVINDVFRIIEENEVEDNTYSNLEEMFIEVYHELKNLHSEIYYS